MLNVIAAFGRKLCPIFLVCILIAGCAAGDTTPSVADITPIDVSRSDVTLEFQSSTQTIISSLAQSKVRNDLMSVLRAAHTGSNKRHYRLTVNIMEFSQYFTAPEWNCRIALQVNIYADGQLLAMIEPKAHAYQFNMWGYGSAGDAERDARHAIASEFARLAAPYMTAGQ